MTDIINCPIVPWYRMRFCEIKTCKNFTCETKHHCLELDRKKPEGTKQFSDAELNLYKFKERKISTRLVQMYRKNAVQDVKAILILHKFIMWIDENFQPRTVVRLAEFAKLERSHPLRIKRLGWKSWMWRYLLNEEVWNRFVQLMGGECATFSVHQLLGIKLDRYTDLISSFKQPYKERKHHGLQGTDSLPSRAIAVDVGMGNEHIGEQGDWQGYHQSHNNGR